MLYEVITHTVKQLVLLTAAIDDLPAAFIMTGKHAAQHDKVGPATERLRHVSGAYATTVGDDPSTQAMGGVGALDHGGELGIADAGLNTRGRNNFV